MYKKKGFSQVDWTISLALFMLFLSITFVVVNPKATVFIDEKGSLNNIKYAFIEDYSYEIQSLPIFIETNRRGVEPIIFPLNYDFDNFVIEGNIPYSFIDNDVIFLYNISQNFTQKKLTYSSLSTKPTYKSNNLFLKLQNETVIIPSKGLYVNYNNGFLENISYLDTTRLLDYKIIDSSSNLEIPFSNKKIVNDSISIVTIQKNNYHEHKDYIFSDLSNIYMNFDSDERFYINFLLDTYKWYYINPSIQGNFTNEFFTCFNITTDYFDFGSTNSIMTMILSPTQVSVCDDNGYLNVKIYNPTKLELHYSKESLGSKYNKKGIIEVGAGIVETDEGISTKKIDEISKKTVNEIRTDYGIPEKIKFELMMNHINYTPIFTYSFASPDINDDVFIRRWKDYVIYENGTKDLRLMGVKVWQ